MLITLLLKKRKKIKEERKGNERRRNAHCDTMRSTIFLLYTTFNCVLYCCTTVYICICFFLLYLCCSFICIYSYSQYSLMRKIQYCTLLCVFCSRLVYNISDEIQFTTNRESEIYIKIRGFDYKSNTFLYK